MKNEEIIEKIKKLLRMKRGGTESEVSNALSLAQKLAAKHNIDLNSINENESKREPVTHKEGIYTSRLQYENKYAAMIVGRFFNVKAFTTEKYFAHQLTIKRTIIFVGTETDILIAEYVYSFLVKHFRYEWKTKRGRLRKRQSFMWGMYKGLFHKLYDLEFRPDQKEGLILSGNKLRLQEYLDENFGNLTSKNVKPDKESAIAAEHGYIAGKNTNIRKGVKTDKEVLQLQ